MEMANELLPIGSVVQLAESTALVMVAGYLTILPSDPERVWNYSGFKFPIGYTDDDELYCFDQEQIEAVYAYGYRDVEYDIFMARLEAKLKEYGEQSAKSFAEKTEKSEAETGKEDE